MEGFEVVVFCFSGLHNSGCFILPSLRIDLRTVALEIFLASDGSNNR